MPARDARAGQTDYPALPEEHQRYVDRLQERQAQLGLEVTVNRGRVYPGGGASDPSVAEQVEEGLKVDEIVGDKGQVYAVTVNRGGTTGAPPPQAASTPYMVDQPAPPGSEPIRHDPMTPQQRKAATRAALAAYQDRRIAADELVEGQDRPGVVMAPHPPALAHAAAGEVVHADRLVGAPLVVDSDSAVQAEREEAELAAQVRRDAQAVRDDQEAIASMQPEGTDNATVDEYGRTVAADVYADRLGKAQAARQSRGRAKAKADEPKAAPEKEGA